MLALSVRAIRCPLYLLTGLIFVSKNDLWYCELQSHYTVVLLLYEKAFPLSEQCSKKAHDQFLADLASILPSNTTPLIVSDAGFKVPWYKSVEKLGWYWLSRVRGKVQYADLGAENWKPISNLHDMSSSHSKTLGYKRLTKSNPISCQILLYKSRSKGRKNQRSTRTHCHHPSPKIYSASAKEPWVLATNLPVEIRTPKQLVNIYSKRMQIEETFRDLKSPAYGLGLRHSRTSSSERFDIMLLIALMLQLTCWLAGVHAQKQVGTSTSRLTQSEIETYSQQFA